jgi:hypothetical protein
MKAVVIDPTTGLNYGRLNITGQRFGRLVAKRFVGIESGKAVWVCQCDCGAVTVARANNLRTGRTRSCGCLQSDLTVERNKRRAGVR